MHVYPLSMVYVVMGLDTHRISLFIRMFMKFPHLETNHSVNLPNCWETNFAPWPVLAISCRPCCEKEALSGRDLLPRWWLRDDIPGLWSSANIAAGGAGGRTGAWDLIATSLGWCRFKLYNYPQMAVFQARLFLKWFTQTDHPRSMGYWRVPVLQQMITF